MVKIYLFDSQCRSSPTLLPKNACSDLYGDYWKKDFWR